MYPVVALAMTAWYKAGIRQFVTWLFLWDLSPLVALL